MKDNRTYEDENGGHIRQIVVAIFSVGRAGGVRFIGAGTKLRDQPSAKILDRQNENQSNRRERRQDFIANSSIKELSKKMNQFGIRLAVLYYRSLIQREKVKDVCRWLSLGPTKITGR